MAGAAAHSDTSPLTRADWALHKLRTAIVFGELAPGTRLRIAELAERLDVSATPLREALQHLAAEGLVELSPQRGARVAPLDIAGGLDVYRVRLMLEPSALATAIRANPPRDWDRQIATSLQELNRATNADPPDIAHFSAIHMQFHQSLLAPCGSAWLLRISRQLAHHSTRFQMLSFGRRGGSEYIVQEHTRLVSLIGDRAADQAQAALRRHIQATVDHVLADEHDTPAIA